MKLNVEAVSKMTGFTVSTVRQYAWKMKLGKQECRQKLFTLAEAKKLGGLKDGSKKAKRVKKPVAKKRKTAVEAQRVAAKQETSKKEVSKEAARKRSIWSFLGIGRK